MRVGLNTYGVDHDDLCRAMVAEHAASLDHVTMLHDTFKNAKTTALDILDPSEAKRWVAYDFRGGKQTEALWKDVGSSSALVHAGSNSEHELDVTVVDLSETTARAIMKKIRKRVEHLPTPPVDRVPMRFWFATPQGPRTNTRQLDVPSWEEISRNYSHLAKQELARLHALHPGDMGTGRIIVLHGPAGTGKTTAIRSLAREWRRWCDFEYIIDPEELLTQGSYLVNVVLAEDNSPEDVPTQSVIGETLAYKWRLLILEDAEEFIRSDVKDRVGQALARLLNIGDGLIGQGLKLMILITTNAKIDGLHPAITRAGRCVAEIEVPLLSGEEASRWLNRPGQREMTLADAFELKHPTQIGVAPASPSVGQFL